MAQKGIEFNESKSKAFRLSEIHKGADSRTHSRSRSISPYDRRILPCADIPKNPKEDNFGRTIAWLNDFTAKKDQVMARVKSSKETPSIYVQKPYEKDDRSSVSPKQQATPKGSVRSSPAPISEKNLAVTPKIPKREGISKPASPSYKATKMRNLKEEISQMLGDLENSVSTPQIHQSMTRTEDEKVERPILQKRDRFSDQEVTNYKSKKNQLTHTPVQFSTFTYKNEPSDLDLSYQKESAYDKDISNQKDEYYVLKQNYDSLVTILQEQEELRANQEAKIGLLENELTEVKTTYELQVDDFKLENNRLKQQLRIIKESHEMSEIFDMYEMEIQRLNSHITAMRLTINDIVNQLESAHENQVDNTDGIEQSFILQKQRRNSLQEIRSTIKKLMKELTEKDTELAEFRKMQLKWNTSRKCLVNVTKRTGKLQFEMEKQKESLVENENITSQITSENRRLKSQNKSLLSEIETIKQENHELNEELKITTNTVIPIQALNTESIDKIHQNIKNISEPKSKFVMNLLKRLQKEIHSIKDVRLSQLIDNIISEMSEVLVEIQNSSIREQNLLHMLVDLQEKLEKNNKSVSHQTNRMLRNSLIAKLTS